MATPWKHPDTGIYYLRRQIPAKLRLAFGGRRWWKASLGTKVHTEAAVLFLQANAELELRFEEARSRLKATGDPRPSRRNHAVELVSAYFEGPERAAGGLDGPERLLLARHQIDRGLWNMTPTGCTPVAPATGDQWWTLANNTALFRDHPGSKPVQGHSPGSIWRLDDERFSAGARQMQVGRLIEQLARHHGLPGDDLPEEIGEVLATYLTKMPVEAAQVRKARPQAGRLRPEMRFMELFAEWKSVMQPAAQTALEYEAAARDFVDFVGDIVVEDITQDDLLNYRDAAAQLPASMPRADRTLPFTERLERHKASRTRRVSPPTVKKRVGGVQALLSFAKAQKWVSSNAGRDVPVIGYKKAGGMQRQPFTEEQLCRLFGSSLFTEPNGWRSDRRVSDMTLYWMFLVGLTTGARIEEIGQALVADVKRNGDITYIDIDDYADEEVEGDKSLKNDSSRRLVPVHDHLMRLGFGRYLDAITAVGHDRLFPDLVGNQFGKRTKEASRVANRLIDRLVSKDARFVFHSFRHGFKDLALEASILERVVDQISGHAPTTVGGRYGNGVRLPILVREFHRVDWSFINWDRLIAASEAIDWSDRVSSIPRPPG